MKNFITAIVVFTVIVINTGCKKPKETTEPTVISETPVMVYPDYAGLKVGNYWIYGRFQVDQNGQVTDLKQRDSCYIEKDTVVRGNTYYKIHKYDFVQYGAYSYYCRDSLHYIVSLQGQIIFSSEDFSTVFYTATLLDNPHDTINPPDTVFKVTRKMTDKDLEIQVPAGTFATSNMQTAYLYYPKFAKVGTPNPRNLNFRYAKNIGSVLETEQFYFSVTSITERRLLRYHLN